MITLALDMPPEMGALLAAVLGVGMAGYYIAKLILPKSVFDYLGKLIKAFLDARK